MAQHIDLVPPGLRLPLRFLMSRYPTLNTPNPEPITNPLTWLSTRMDTRRFHEVHAGTTLMCVVFPMIVTTIPKRLRQRKRALGGRKRPQRFSRHDLAVKRLDANTLPKELALLCKLLKREVPRLIRLMLEAQAAYEEGLEMYWNACHEALAISLLNMESLFVAIRKQSTPRIALLCLRWALRCGWEAYMRKGSFTEEARPWLEEIEITLKEEVELWRILSKEGNGSAPPPEPFLPLIARWRAGNVPPLPPKDRRIPWPEGEQVRCKI